MVKTSLTIKLYRGLTRPTGNQCFSLDLAQSRVREESLPSGNRFTRYYAAVPSYDFTLSLFERLNFLAARKLLLRAIVLVLLVYYNGEPWEAMIPYYVKPVKSGWIHFVFP